MIALVRLVDHLLLMLFSLSILAISGQDMSKKKEKLFAKNLENLDRWSGGQPEKYSMCHKTWFQWKPSPTFEIYIVYIAHWDRLT